MNKQTKPNVDINKYNIGVLTGIINNIIVIDVDFKDDGINEFNKYIEYCLLLYF